jgi:hypothetical protein
VQVKVRDSHLGITSDVHDEPVATFANTFFLRHLLSQKYEAVDDTGVTIGEMVRARDVRLWHDQEMYGGLRRNVSKR